MEKSEESRARRREGGSRCLTIADQMLNEGRRAKNSQKQLIFFALNHFL